MLISFPPRVWTPKENAGHSWLFLLIPCQLGSIITDDDNDVGVPDKHLGSLAECQEDTG